MNVARLNRREILENCIVKGLLIAGVPMSASNLLALWQKSEHEAGKATPEEVLGPFFKKGASNVKNLREAGDAGVPLRVTGKVLNTRGEPVIGARIDVWHADHHGRYDVQGYRYRTNLEIETAAGYELETVMPGHYADRPAQHIHYLIFGARTQDPDYAVIFCYRSIFRRRPRPKLRQRIDRGQPRTDPSGNAV